MTQTRTISRDIQSAIDALLDELDALRVAPDLAQAVHLPCGKKVTVRPGCPHDTDMIQPYIYVASLPLCGAIGFWVL
jgi:hypothetical protein